MLLLSTAWAKMMDGTGWAYKFSPAGQQDIEEIANVNPTCRIRGGVHLNVRKTADCEAARTGKVLEPGQVFKISRKIAVPGGGGQVFYKLAGHEGWIYRLTGEGKQVVEEVTKAPGETDCVIM
jgi:hypothetical protein